MASAKFWAHRLAGIIFAIILGIISHDLGELNGMLVTRGKLPPLLPPRHHEDLQTVVAALHAGYTPAVPKGFLKISSLEIGGQLLMPIIYWVILAVLLHIVFTRTTFGRQVIAVGSNERATKLSGVNVNKIKRRIYALMGLLVSLSAVIQVARIGSMDYANAGSGYEMDAISAVIVGGTSMMGGKGTIVGTLFCTLIIAVMNNLLNLMGTALPARSLQRRHRYRRGTAAKERQQFLICAEEDRRQISLCSKLESSDAEKSLRCGIFLNTPPTPTPNWPAILI
jgi:ribose/xylose/arabinose/galactoside ABC-type transport system permease subunit